jgi:hypothetical protein
LKENETSILKRAETKMMTIESSIHTVMEQALEQAARKAKNDKQMVSLPS